LCSCADQIDTIRNTIVLSVVVVVVSGLLTVLLSRLLVSPLLGVSALLNEAVQAIGMERGRAQRSALRRINREFRKQTGTTVKDMAEASSSSTIITTTTATQISVEHDNTAVLVKSAVPVIAAIADANTVSRSQDVNMTVLAHDARAAMQPGLDVALPGVTSMDLPDRRSFVSSAHDIAVSRGAARSGVTVVPIDGTAGGKANDVHLMSLMAGRAVGTSSRQQPVGNARSHRFVAQPPSLWKQIKTRLCCGCRNKFSMRSHARASCLQRLTGRVGEVRLMHRSIGSILHALTSNDQLEIINQAKREFIRYVHHLQQKQ
jgi:hypothetical protein